MDFKRGDKCPCGRSHFRAYVKGKNGLLPKFQSREVFLANKAADLRRQRFKRAQKIARKRGMPWCYQSPDGSWSRVSVGGEYSLLFQDGFCLRVRVTRVGANVCNVLALYNRKEYDLFDIIGGKCPKALESHSESFLLFDRAQR